MAWKRAKQQQYDNLKNWTEKAVFDLPYDLEFVSFPLNRVQTWYIFTTFRASCLVSCMRKQILSVAKQQNNTVAYRVL